MRILYCANAPWSGSGYGVQAQHLLPRLAALPCVGGPENIGIFAYWGLQGGMTQWGPFAVYPAGVENYGNDVIGLHAKDFGADIVITMIDAWVLKDVARKVAPAQWWPWFPVDSAPCPARVVKALEGAARPLVYSQWGKEQLARAGIAADYVPIGVDTDTFKVLEPHLVAEFRKAVFGEDCRYLTAMVAANVGYPDRKAFQVQLRAWARFAQYRQGAKLYIHTEPSTIYDGVDLRALVADLGISERVIFPESYQYFLGYPAQYLALIYNAADVLLGASMAEGFGIPLVEAQACGCSVIATNFSSMPELVTLGQMARAADQVWSPLNAWQAWPSVEGIEVALRDSVALPASKVTRKRASERIHATFGWDAVVERHWRPLLEGWGQ